MWKTSFLRTALYGGRAIPIRAQGASQKLTHFTRLTAANGIPVSDEVRRMAKAGGGLLIPPNIPFDQVP